MSDKNRYGKIIEKIFFDRYREGLDILPFVREDLEHAASELKIALPKNLGDLSIPSVIETLCQSRFWQDR